MILKYSQILSTEYVEENFKRGKGGIGNFCRLSLTERKIKEPIQCHNCRKVIWFGGGFVIEIRKKLCIEYGHTIYHVSYGTHNSTTLPTWICDPA